MRIIRRQEIFGDVINFTSLLGVWFFLSRHFFGVPWGPYILWETWSQINLEVQNKVQTRASKWIKGIFIFTLYIYLFLGSSPNWDSLIKRRNTCAVLCLVVQSCPTLCAPMDCSPPGSSVHGVFSRQEYWSGWPAMLSSRGSSQPKDWTQVSCIAGRFFTI